MFSSSDNFTFEDGSHVPSYEQKEELIDNCDYEFIKYKGVNGGMFTSKINGNSIFIPAAGHCDNGSLHGDGRYGCSWTNSLWALFFITEGAHRIYEKPEHGLPVRGVI